MIRHTGMALVIAMAFVANVPAATQQLRIRGTIETVNEDSVTLKSRAGEDVNVTLGADTAYVYVVKSELSAIKSNTFIGTATKQVHGTPVALEVVIFPESMRGTAEGHYPWDKLPDTTKSGAGAVSSSMTNAAVKTNKAAKGGMPSTNSAMTNGTVKASNTQRGTRMLTVTYKGGKQQILVPPTAPIVAFAPGESSILKRGAKAFIIADKKDDALAAALVAVGKNGLTPPM